MEEFFVYNLKWLDFKRNILNFLYLMYGLLLGIFRMEFS